MKKLLVFCILLHLGFAFALQEAWPHDLIDHRTHESEGGKSGLEVPQFSFVHGPDTLKTTYYDYMIGGYNNQPLQRVPNMFGGGYFCAFHARTERMEPRRVYWARIDNSGMLTSVDTISHSNINEGHPALALDHDSGKPLYVWHANVDEDPSLEVMFAYDRILDGSPGDIITPVIIIDNPITIGSTSDNEFVWPEITIGLSPNPEMRRVYVMTKNSTDHYLPCENAMLAYADFNTDMLLSGSDLAWNYSTVPLLNDWNIDPVNNRRPNYTLKCDPSGKVYLIGYHSRYLQDQNIYDENSLDIFVCDNYGEGTWVYHSYPSVIPSWNPILESFYPDGYYQDDEGNAYDELFWVSSSSNHFNAVFDNAGRLQAIGSWILNTPSGAFFPDFFTIKSYRFDPADNTMVIKDVYPRGNTQNVAYPHFTPWDTEYPWGETDSWTFVDGVPHPQVQTIFPFPHWDTTAANDAMIFHYNMKRYTEVNQENMMVALWQDSKRARDAHNAPDQHPEDLPYLNSPETVIICSADGGASWSDPLYLNDIDTPLLSGIRMMYVYPADQVVYTGMQGTRKVGRLGLLFVDDGEWGSEYVFNPHVWPDSSMVMFAEIELVFPEPTAIDDPHISTPSIPMLQNAYPNPFKDALTISVALKDSEEEYSLSIYNLRGQKVYSHTDRAKGEFELQWTGLDSAGKRVPAGIYLLKLDSGAKSQSRKIIRF